MTQDDASLLQDPYVAAFPETLPFWRAAARGELLLPRCTRCLAFHWHPRVFCPFCHHDGIDWLPSPGRGTVYSFSVVRRKPASHVLAYVQLDEGPILMTNITGVAPESVATGMAVEAWFQACPEGRHMPMFRPRG